MVIPGEIGYDLNYYSLKLTSFKIHKTFSVTLSDYVGLTLTGANFRCSSKSCKSVATDGTDPNTLYVKYLRLRYK